MSMRYRDRALVSFQGRCPMNCKHCYTFDLDEQEEILEASAVASAALPEDCDIIYVSQRYENFYHEPDGTDLCRALYRTHHKDIFVITRSFLHDDTLRDLSRLHRKMAAQGHTLFLSVSLCANESYGVTEDPAVCPTPLQRLSNLQRAHALGIQTILMLRPVFPDAVIPVSECCSLVARYADAVDAVVTSGLIVTEGVLARLHLDESALSFATDGDSSYLADLKGEDVRYVDVERELREIERACAAQGVPCFRHSMPALNFLAQHRERRLPQVGSSAV